MKPSVSVGIDGKLFGRWLCKAFCGALTAYTDETPHIEFVRYAFDRESTRHVYFFFPDSIGDPARYGRSRHWSLVTLLTDDPDVQGFYVKLWNFPCLVSTSSEIRTYPELPPNKGDWIDRVARVELVDHAVSGPDLRTTTAHRLNFDWSDDRAGLLYRG